MDKNVIKIIALVVGLVALVAIILVVAINGISLGIFNVVSIAGIAEQNAMVEEVKGDLKKAKDQYNINLNSLETAKKNFEEQKKEYDDISDEKIAAVKEATKNEEYFIEYLWITLGKYATLHNLALAIIEPGGSISVTTQTAPTEPDPAAVSTGTGITGDSTGTSTTTNAATTGSPTSGVKTGDETNNGAENVNTPTRETLNSSSTDLTVQVSGSYMDLADFVFEVENDKSLRFRLDNIKMKSAGGNEVITSFNVKDFTVLKSLHSR